MQYYKIPFLSKVAGWIVDYLLTDRIRAWMWISAYHDLDEHMRNVNDHHDDGSISHYSAVSEVQIENIKRGLYRDYLKATLENK